MWEAEERALESTQLHTFNFFSCALLFDKDDPYPAMSALRAEDFLWPASFVHNSARIPFGSERLLNKIQIDKYPAGALFRLEHAC